MHKDYHDSMQSIEGGRILTLVGQSGTGKTTLMKRLVETGLFCLIPSTTTRPYRPSDLDDEYRYLDLETYASVAAQPGRFLWDVPAGNGHSYAKDVLDVNKALTDPEHVHVQALIPESAKIFARKYGEQVVKTVFLTSPGDDELRRRMQARGDAPEKIEERLASEREQDWPEQVLAIDGLKVITSQELLVRQSEIFTLFENATAQA